jgi:hypothetical protein
MTPVIRGEIFPFQVRLIYKPRRSFDSGSAIFCGKMSLSLGFAQDDKFLYRMPSPLQGNFIADFRNHARRSANLLGFAQAFARI